MRSVQQTSPAEFVICADEAPELNVPFEFHKWSEETEAQEVAAFDIGIMPLSDTPWTQGKCGFKLLQYFAAGKPVVCSPVGVNTEIVEEGVSGFFAKDQLVWARQINILARDADLRDRMGKAGQKTVEERYACKVICPLLCDVLRHAYDETKQRREAGIR